MRGMNLLVLAVLTVLLVGCTGNYSPDAPRVQPPVINATVGEAVPADEVAGNNPPQEEQLELPQEEVREQLPVLLSQFYSDPRNKITFEYPANWMVTSELMNEPRSLTMKIVDQENHPSAEIRVSYSITALTLDEKEEQLLAQGAELERILVRGQDFIMYDIEFESGAGRLVHERIAVTIQDGTIYYVVLRTWPSEVYELLPTYEAVLNSIQIL